MIFLDEGFWWRFEIQLKDIRDGVVYRNILESFSNLDPDDWDQSDKV